MALRLQVRSNRPCRLSGLLAICVTFSAASCRQSRDTELVAGQGFPSVVYVRQSQGVGYSAVDGEIVDLTCDFVRVNTAGKDGGRLLYSRDVVQRVKLFPYENVIDAKKGDADNKNRNAERRKQYDQWQKLVDTCWNRSKSRFVAIVASIPALGESLSRRLDTLPAGFDTLIAAVILVVALLYGSFRFYELALAATHTNKLNSAKLSKEILKLKYEIEDLKHKLGRDIPEPVSETESTGVLPRIPQLHVRDFMEHKLLRIPTEKDMDLRRKQWRQRWQEYRETGHPALQYYRRWIFNWFLTFWAALFCFMSLIYVFLFPLMPELSDGGMVQTLAYSFLFLLFFLFSGSAFLNLRAQRRILRETYREARSAPA